jgi:hypothetical protein
MPSVSMEVTGLKAVKKLLCAQKAIVFLTEKKHRKSVPKLKGLHALHRVLFHLHAETASVMMRMDQTVIHFPDIKNYL